LFNIVPLAAGPNLPVFGGGTLGRLTKWTGFTSSNSFVSDTSIFEDKYGNVGVGTDSPASKLTVAGAVESTTGGFKFPDGTLQTTSAAGSLLTVTHDMTLSGNGTVASPLGVASPLMVRDLDNPALQPIQASGLCTAQEPNGGCAVEIYTVPEGKRLVIEFVSMLAVVPSGQQASLDIGTKVNGQFSHFHIPYSQPALGGSAVAVTNIAQQLRIYADPGTTVGVNCASTSSKGATFDISFAGYLVNIP